MGNRRKQEKSTRVGKVNRSKVSKSKHHSKANFLKNIIENEDSEELKILGDSPSESPNFRLLTGSMDWSDSSDELTEAKINHIPAMYPVVKESHIIIQLLDARQPLASRSAVLEKYAESAGKQIVLVLNKSDLLPKEVLRQWLEELRKEFPTYVVRSRIPLSAKKLCHVPKPSLSDESLCTLPPLGFEHLLRGLGKYKKQQKISEPLKVCLFGPPNAGKFTFIYSLKSICEWEPVEDSSEILSSILISNQIKLFETPARLVTKAEPTEIHPMSPQEFDTIDYKLPIKCLLDYVDIGMLCRYYQIKKCKDAEELLFELSAKKIKSKKVDATHEKCSASLIWNDWLSGQIKHYTEVPPNLKIREHTETSMALLEKFGQHESSDSENKMINHINSVHPKMGIPTVCMGIFKNFHVDWMKTESQEQKIENIIAKRKKKNRRKIVIEVNKKTNWGPVLREVNKAKNLLHQLESMDSSSME